jgi:hypothetical protein
LDDVKPHTLYGCNVTPAVVDLYRETTSSSHMNGMTSSGAVISSSTTTSDASRIGLSAPSDSGLNSATEPSDDAGSSGSAAWIAGPVVGGIVVLGLLALAVLFWRRKRRSGAAADAVVASAGLPSPSGLPPIVQLSPSELESASSMDAKNVMNGTPLELHQSAVVGELPGDVRFELSGQGKESAGPGSAV